MTKWADFLISEVSYDSNRLIKFVKRHKDIEDGISHGKIADRLTVASDIKNGLTYITVFKGLNYWKKGNKIQTFQIKGNPYVRIDENKVTYDNLGEIPELNIDSLNDDEKKELEKNTNNILSSKSNLSELREKQMRETDAIEQESKPVFEKHLTPEKPLQSPRGSLPKDTGEELSQELDLAPEPEDEEVTSEQFDKLDDLKKQIDDLEISLSKLDNFSESDDESKPLTKSTAPKRNAKKSVTGKIKQQNKKLNEIEQKLNPSKTPESDKHSKILDAYCMKCKTKRMVKNPQKTTMKNGRPAIRGTCSKCGTKVFRIIKKK